MIRHCSHTFLSLGWPLQQGHTYLLSVSCPHAETLHLAVLPDAADVVHFLKDSLGSAANTHTENKTQYDKLNGFSGFV